MGKKTDISGVRFGKLLVLERSGPSNPRAWKCQCDCGSPPVHVQLNNLRSGCSRSCGCIRKAAGPECRNWKGYGQISGTYWERVRFQAAERGLVVDMTIVDAWEQFERQGGMCALTGWPLNFRVKGYGQTASLDRVRSDQGYVPGNIQWVHKDVNKFKNDFTPERFFEICEAIVAHRRLKNDSSC